MEKIIEVKDLVKSYGDVLAVKGITFDVYRGSLFAFLGVNGAGKSTTINILSTAMRLTSGKVTVCGRDLIKEPEEIKRQTGIVFQESVLDRNLTVLENLRSRAALYGISPAEMNARTEEVVEEFQLKDFVKRRYGKLSGGQRRRVDIARALINSPKLLFLDEPTTGLDPATRSLVWELLEKRRRRGLTIFLTTHYMEESVRADKVVIIDEGKIAVSGTPDELKNKYASDILRLVGARDGALENGLDVAGKKYTYRNGSYDIRIKSPREGVEFLKDRPEIVDFEILKGNMDDVFLNVTGKKLGQGGNDEGI